MEGMYAFEIDAYTQEIYEFEPSHKYHTGHVRGDDLAAVHKYVNKLADSLFDREVDNVHVKIELLTPTHLAFDYHDLATGQEFTLTPVAFEDSRFA